MRFGNACFILCWAALCQGQVTDPRVEVSDVFFDESRRTLSLNLENRGSAAITAYHLLVTQDCPEGQMKGTDELIKMLPVLDPRKVGSWYRSGSDQGPIQPQSSRLIKFRVEKRTTSGATCQGANLRILTAVFADGTGSGKQEVIRQILDHRRGESDQYSRWLEPFRDALVADDAQAKLEELQIQLEQERDRLDVNGSDDRIGGARSANRDILARVKQIRRFYEEESSLAQDVGEKMVRLHELRSAALAKYAL